MFFLNLDDVKRDIEIVIIPNIRSIMNAKCILWVNLFIMFMGTILFFSPYMKICDTTFSDTPPNTIGNIIAILNIWPRLESITLTAEPSPLFSFLTFCIIEFVFGDENNPDPDPNNDMYNAISK